MNRFHSIHGILGLANVRSQSCVLISDLKTKTDEMQLIQSEIFENVRNFGFQRGRHFVEN